MRNYSAISKRLRRYSENCVAYKLDADFADAVSDAADAIEELQRPKTTDTVYGYPVNELIAFAAACRENGVEEKDLKTFANNVRFAFEIVHAEAEAAFQRAMWGIGGKGVK